MMVKLTAVTATSMEAFVNLRVVLVVGEKEQNYQSVEK